MQAAPTPTSLILHQYDASPFSQKALMMLGIKGAAYHSVEMPMMPPKDAMMALTGGYRGTPVLQVGSDVYVDSQLIARELDRLLPEPLLVPVVNGAMERMMVRSADAFFRTALGIVLGVALPFWPEAFRKDREHLFPDIDFNAAAANLTQARAQYRAHAALLEEQLADGRPFLMGGRPSLADVQAWPFTWMLRQNLPDQAAALLAGFDAVHAWESRCAAIGHGQRQELPADEALAVALASAPQTVEHVDPADAQGLRAGQAVTVMPEDTRRGEVAGTVAVATPTRVAVRRQHPAVGEVVVHFPRLGYRITPA
jgi:glutathione S-transferase